MQLLEARRRLSPATTSTTARAVGVAASSGQLQEARLGEPESAGQVNNSVQGEEGSLHFGAKVAL